MAKGKKQKQEEKAVSLSVRFLRVLTLEIPFCRTRGDNMGGRVRIGKIKEILS